MKPRLQSSILLLVTLLIGVLLGALLQSSIRDKRIRHMDFLKSNESFVAHLLTVIAPTSTAQEERVRAVLTAEAPLITGGFKAHRDLIREQFQAMELRLQPLLEEKQQERLNRRLFPPRRRPEKQEEPAGD